MTKEEALVKVKGYLTDYLPWDSVDEIDEIIKALEPNIGQWMPNHIPGSMLYKCDQCGYDRGAYSFKYCSNCGAKMKG